MLVLESKDLFEDLVSNGAITESSAGHSIILLDQLLPGDRVCDKVSEFQGP